MRPNYSNQLNASFRLFLDHKLAANGGYTNVSGILQPSFDPNYSQFQVYQSPFRQFGADSSISGMIICTGANSVPNGIWNETTSYWQLETMLWNGNETGTALSVDFERGRVITDYTLGTPVTAQYAIKTWNLYYNFQDEPSLLLNRAFQLQSPVPFAVSGLNWDDQPYPCAYISNKFQENTPWAFGGTDRSDNQISVILLTNSSFDLDATCGLLANCSQKYFNLISVASFPFDILGGLKNGNPYNYNTLCSQQNSSELVYIKKVRISKFNQSLNKQLAQNMCGAFVDFELQLPRDPRRY